MLVQGLFLCITRPYKAVGPLGWLPALSESQAPRFPCLAWQAAAAAANPGSVLSWAHVKDVTLLPDQVSGGEQKRLVRDRISYVTEQVAWAEQGAEDRVREGLSP